MTRTELLDKAKAIVNGHRTEEYGTPENSFQRIADLWSAYSGSVKYTSSDVAVMMILLKLARVAEHHDTADSWIDIAGYAACGGEVADV